jgi:hypothetical protein
MGGLFCLVSQDLVDMGVFCKARRVVDALKNHDCTEALQWCAENSSRLNKMKVLYLMRVSTTLRFLIDGSIRSLFVMHLFRQPLTELSQV